MENAPCPANPDRPSSSSRGQPTKARTTPPRASLTLEVLNIVDDNLSQGQVVSVKDSFKDPILPGDFLYNPIFRPGGAQHVVIAGRIDMHGTKADDLEEFKRLLDRQNVVVDGFVDLAGDGSVKGRLTVATDYLVLGDVEEPEGRDIEHLTASRTCRRRRGATACGS